MATFVHIADVHVGMGFKTASFAKELGNERRDEIKESLFRVVDYCEENGKDLLLIAGDLFEEDYVSISDLKDMNHKFGTLTNTKVLIGAGNHDPVIDQSSCYNLIKWCDNVHLFGSSFETLTLDDINTKVHSFSWDKIYLPALQSESLPSADAGYCHVMMLHGDVYQKSDYQYIDPTLFEGLGFDYIALGHIHKYDFIRPNMAYSGALEPMDFSETGEHGFIEGEIGDGECKASFVPFCKRSFHVMEVALTGDMPYEAIKDHLRKELQSYNPEDMYRLILTGYVDSDVSLDLKGLKQALSEQVHYVEIKDRTQPDLDIETLKKDYEGSLIGAYITYMEQLDVDEGIRSEALYEGLRILLREQVI